MNAMPQLGIWQLAAGYVFIVLLLIIVKIRGIAREREILISSIRMTLQLILIGYILTYVFQFKSMWLSLLIVTVMEIFAVQNIIKRIKQELTPQLKKTIFFSMVGGTFISLVFFIGVVLRLTPWYEPRYFIPISGMIIGNSMTGITLGVSRLTEGMEAYRKQIEAALMLGASPVEASRKTVNQAFDAAILPTINSMVGMGIVFLPGMMTGQIIAGAEPLSSIAYQIAIMLGIVGSVSLTVISFVHFGVKTFFNERCQLKSREPS